jgi:uncharacterized protein (DUF697 family)
MDADKTTVVAEVSVQKDEVDRIIRYHVWGAMGIGLIPIPVVDFVGLTGIQLNMLRQLAKAYHIPFFKDRVRTLISPLIGAAVPGVFSMPIALSLAKIIPVLGQTAGVVTMPIIAGASTYAIGKIFVQHFASGGTFLTFDPEKVKAYYAELYQEGQEVAATMKQEAAQK